VAIATATFATAGEDTAYGVATDQDGAIYAAGVANGVDAVLFKYNGSPLVTGVEPLSAQLGDHITLRVHGKNFLPGAVIDTGDSCRPAATVAPDLVTATVDISSHSWAGRRTVTVMNLDGSSGSLAAAFNVRPLPLSPDSDATARYLTGFVEMTIAVPQGSFAQPLTIEVSSASVPGRNPQGFRCSRVCFDLTNSLNSQPAHALTLTLDYRDEDVAGLDESKLVLARYDELLGRWRELPTTVYPAQNRLVASVDHFSQYALLQRAPAADLSGVTLYPNPFDPRGGGLALGRLGERATIRIFTVGGELVRTIEHADASGRAAWDGKNDGGSTVASGRSPSDTRNCTCP
jgi:hypothetical protein